MLLTGFQELEAIRTHDYNQYRVKTTPYVGHEYAAKELRYLRNAKTHYNERFLKMHGESVCYFKYLNFHITFRLLYFIIVFFFSTFITVL